MLDDVQSAVRYLRAHAKAYGVDPNHVGACGASAGGQLALLLGNRDTRDPNPADNPAVSSRVSVVFDMFGPTDLSRDFPASFDFLSVLVTGKKKEDAGPEIREMSVMNFLGANSPPTFILHGLADPLVPPVQSQRLEDSLKQLNVPVQGVYIKGMVHGIDAKIPGELDAVGAGIRWLKTYLEPKASGGKAA
jgi:acetyl esterase/lipase